MSDKELLQAKLQAVVDNTAETKEKVGVVIQMLRDAKENGQGMSPEEVTAALEKLGTAEANVQAIEDSADAAIANSAPAPEAPEEGGAQ